MVAYVPASQYAQYNYYDDPTLGLRTAPLDYEDEFVPGALYIMASVPAKDYFSITRREYPDELPYGLTFASYDSAAAAGLCREEFHWDLYFHRGASGGRLYRLSNRGAALVPDHLDVPNPRSLGQVIGFVRIVTVEASAMRTAEQYIDKVAQTTARQVTRTFAWAVTAAHRVRKNLGASAVADYFAVGEFTPNALTVELVRFAHAHVQEVLDLGRDAKKSIIRSWFDVTVPRAIVRRMLEERRAREMLFLRKPKYTWGWYNVAQEVV